MVTLVSKFNKDASWVLYTNKAWKQFAEEHGYTSAVIRNIWKDLRKDPDSSKWLDGRGSTMLPTTDKLENGKAPVKFGEVLKKFLPADEETETTSVVSRVKMVEYEGWQADIIHDVLESFTSGSTILDLAEGSPVMFIFFLYSSDGMEIPIYRTDVSKFYDLGKHVPADEFIDEGGNEASKRPENPHPLFVIGTSRVRDNVVSASARFNQT